MATINSHVYFIQNLINRGPVSDDTRYSNRLIAHALKQARTRLLKIKLDNSDTIADTNYQKICIPLERHTYHDCGCIIDNNECLLLRSISPLPKYMIAKWGSTLEILYKDGRKLSNTSIISNDLSEYSLTNTTPRVGYFLDSGYLYVLNNYKLQLLVGKAIWDDPDQVNDFNEAACAGAATCSEYFSEEFPLDGELIFPMYQLTLQLLGVSFQLPEDNRNDGRAVEVLQALDPNESTRR